MQRWKLNSSPCSGESRARQGGTQVGGGTWPFCGFWDLSPAVWLRLKNKGGGGLFPGSTIALFIVIIYIINNNKNDTWQCKCCFNFILKKSFIYFSSYPASLKGQWSWPGSLHFLISVFIVSCRKLSLLVKGFTDIQTKTELHCQNCQPCQC